MSTQSGITATRDALDQFYAFTTSGHHRALLLEIRDECVQVSQTISHKADLNSTLDHLSTTNIIDDTTAYYVILNTADSHSHSYGSGSSTCITSTKKLAFVAYIPDNAATRTKMVYAATTSQLLHDLGGKELFSSNVFTFSHPSELTPSGWRDTIVNLNGAAPLTAEERHRLDLQQGQLLDTAQFAHSRANGHLYSSTAGAAGAVGGGNGSLSSGNGGGLKLAVESDVEAAVAQFASSSNNDNDNDNNNNNDDSERFDTISLNIDLSSETVHLIGAQSNITLEELSSNSPDNNQSPQYTLLRQNATVWFGYNCPPTAPIRAKMIYASNKQGLISWIQSQGIKIARVLEADDLDEIKSDLIAEIAAATKSSPATGSSRLRFAKPKGPGRR